MVQPRDYIFGTFLGEADEEASGRRSKRILHFLSTFQELQNQFIYAVALLRS